MKKNKKIAGGLSVLIGYIIFMLIMDLLSKPSNVPISLKPIESLQSYFFGITFSIGNIGWILGSLLLTVFLTLCYFVGTWIYKMTFKHYK